MILALGARGPEFDSRNAPNLSFLSIWSFPNNNHNFNILSGISNHKAVIWDSDIFQNINFWQDSMAKKFFFFKVNIRDWKQGGQAKEIPASSILKFKHSVLLPSVYTSSNWSKEWKTTFRSYSLFNIIGKWHKKLHSNPRDQKLLNHKKRIHFKFIRNFMQRKLENQPRQLGIWSSGMILA